MTKKIISIALPIVFIVGCMLFNVLADGELKRQISEIAEKALGGFCFGIFIVGAVWVLSGLSDLIRDVLGQETEIQKTDIKEDL